MWIWAVNVLNLLLGFAKHPVFRKLAFFSVFFSLIIFIVDYFLNIVKVNVNLQVVELLSYLGVVNAIQIFISFAISVYIANHLIGFFKSV